MASKGKRKTTMAKLTREARLRERRFEKEERKAARKAAALDPEAHDTPELEDATEPVEQGTEPVQQD